MLQIKGEFLRFAWFQKKKKKTPTSKGVRCRRNKHTMRKLHGANLELFFYI